MTKKLIIYIHGKGGNANEAEHYKPLLQEYDVIGFDYSSQTPWEAEEEFPRLFDAITESYDSVSVIANSIGAYFAMLALSDKRIDKAYFISPVADMQKLITDMMRWAGVSEAELQEKGTIETAFNETISWDYLCYVREHPIHWNVPTHILYGGKDNLISQETVATFAHQIDASLCIMPDGEHWFHTERQMQFLDEWIITKVSQ